FGQLALTLQRLVNLAPELLVQAGRVQVPELVALRIGRQGELDDLAQCNRRKRKRAMLASRFRVHDREISLPASHTDAARLISMARVPPSQLCRAFMNKVTNHKASVGKSLNRYFDLSPLGMLAPRAAGL